MDSPFAIGDIVIACLALVIILLAAIILRHISSRLNANDRQNRIRAFKASPIKVAGVLFFFTGRQGHPASPRQPAANLLYSMQRSS